MTRRRSKEKVLKGRIRKRRGKSTEVSQSVTLRPNPVPSASGLPVQRPVLNLNPRPNAPRAAEVQKLSGLIQRSGNARTRDLYLLLELRLRHVTSGQWSVKDLVDSMTKFKHDQWVTDLKKINGTYKTKGESDCIKYANQMFKKQYLVGVKPQILGIIERFTQQTDLLHSFCKKFAASVPPKPSRAALTRILPPVLRQTKTSSKNKTSAAQRVTSPSSTLNSEIGDTTTAPIQLLPNCVIPLFRCDHLLSQGQRSMTIGTASQGQPVQSNPSSNAQKNPAKQSGSSVAVSPSQNSATIQKKSKASLVTVSPSKPRKSTRPRKPRKPFTPSDYVNKGVVASAENQIGEEYQAATPVIPRPRPFRILLTRCKVPAQKKKQTNTGGSSIIQRSLTPNLALTQPPAQTPAKKGNRKGTAQGVSSPSKPRKSNRRRKPRKPFTPSDYNFKGPLPRPNPLGYLTCLHLLSSDEENESCSSDRSDAILSVSGNSATQESVLQSRVQNRHNVPNESSGPSSSNDSDSSDGQHDSNGLGGTNGSGASGGPTCPGSANSSGASGDPTGPGSPNGAGAPGDSTGPVNLNGSGASGGRSGSSSPNGSGGSNGPGYSSNQNVSGGPNDSDPIIISNGPNDDDEDDPDDPDNSSTVSGTNSTVSRESSNKTVDAKGLAKCLGLTDKELNFRPLSDFDAELPSQVLHKIFDFEAGSFLPFLYQKPLNDAMSSKLVTCAFNARSGPEYPKREFCKMRGRCKCGIEIIVRFPHKPVKGQDCQFHVELKNLQKYKLFQDKPTNRQCRNVERKELGKKLQTVKSIQLLLEKASLNDKLKYIHNNNEEYTLETLKRIKSDFKYIDRTSMDPVEDLRNRAERFHKEHNANIKISGFIHNIVAENDITVYLYDHTSLEIHYQQMKKGAIVYLDSTGNLVANYKGKQVLTYLLVGKTTNDVTYLIGEMITSNLTQQSPRNFLQHLKDRIIWSGSNRHSTPFCRVAVCDFSFALIQGYISALCETNMQSYCKFSWEVFTGKIGKCNNTVVYICAAHLIKAFGRNLKAKLPKGTSHIIHIALFGIARLAECLTLPEFRKISFLIIQTFLSEFLPADRIKSNISELKCKDAGLLSAVADESASKSDSTFDISDFTRSSLKTNSEFYKEFCRIKGKHRNIGKEPNRYYCPEVISVLETSYVAYFFLWGRFMVTKTKDDAFLRTTTAPVESQFNIKRNYLHDRRDAIFNYAEIAFRHFKGWNRLQMKQIFLKSKPKSRKKKSTPIQKKLEVWRRRAPQSQTQNEPSKRRVSTYYSTKPEASTSSQQTLMKLKGAQLKMKTFQYVIRYQGFSLYACQIKELFDRLRHLNDLVVDAYMRYLINTTGSHNRFYATSAIIIGKPPSESHWNELDDPTIQLLPDNIEILHPFCLGLHWVLLRISFQESLCTIYDSLNSQSMETELRGKVLKHFEKQKNETRNWRIEYAEVHSQNEQWECGVHVLRNAEMIMTDRDEEGHLDDREKLYHILCKLLITTDIGKEIVQMSSNLQDLEDIFDSVPASSSAQPATRRSPRNNSTVPKKA